MNLPAVLIAAVFAVCFVLAVRYLVRHGLCSECESGCHGCGGSCHGGKGCKATMAMAEKLHAKTEAARKDG